MLMWATCSTVGWPARACQAVGGRLVAVDVDDHREVLADDLLGSPAGHPLDRVGHEREAALGIGREHDVGRVLDEEPVAALRVAQVALEPVPFAHVADRPVRPDERAGVVEPGGGDELGRDRLAVAGRAG